MDLRRDRKEGPVILRGLGFFVLILASGCALKGTGSGSGVSRPRVKRGFGVSNDAFHFSAMGTVWKIEIADSPKSVDIPALQQILSDEVYAYDQTFSDWNEESELRKL